MFIKKYKILILVLFLSAAFFIISPNIARAGIIDTVGQFLFGASDVDIAAMEAQRATLAAKLKALETDPTTIKVVDKATIEAAQVQLKALDKQIADAKAKWNWEKIKAAWQLKNEELAGFFFKDMIGYFLNTLAYDTATYLATGDKGQQPMFETEGWGEYIKNTADNAMGNFIEEWGKNGPLKFNLCQPDPSVVIKIGLVLSAKARPKKPPCTFSELTKNWDQALHDKDFLNKATPTDGSRLKYLRASASARLARHIP